MDEEGIQWLSLRGDSKEKTQVFTCIVVGPLALWASHYVSLLIAFPTPLEVQYTEEIERKSARKWKGLDLPGFIASFKGNV